MALGVSQALWRSFCSLFKKWRLKCSLVYETQQIQDVPVYVSIKVTGEAIIKGHD